MILSTPPQSSPFLLPIIALIFMLHVYTPECLMNPTQAGPLLLHKLCELQEKSKVPNEWTNKLQMSQAREKAAPGHRIAVFH